jgi:hypothetical protein
MKQLTSLSPFLIPLFAIVSCNRTNEINPCLSPVEVTAKQECYNPLLGLPLTVSGNRQAEGWEWRVYVVEDTTSGNLTNLQIRKPSSDKLTVPDSILSRYPMIHVQVGTNCGDSVKESMYFSFVRRESNNCTTWVRKSI